jgi:hypothetical protein
LTLFQVPEELLNVSTSTQRSRTLPVGTLPSQMYQKNSAKHIRSLSESKTTDGITSMVMNRTRFNSGDSNTSGVSSCDSVNMRTAISEFFECLDLIFRLNLTVFKLGCVEGGTTNQ